MAPNSAVGGVANGIGCEVGAAEQPGPWHGTLGIEWPIGSVPCAVGEPRMVT